MKTDLSFLERILEDDPKRNGLRYPYFSAMIRQSDPTFTLEGRSVLVTALDSIRPVLKRVMSMRARHILVPLHMF